MQKKHNYGHKRIEVGSYNTGLKTQINKGTITKKKTGERTN